MPTDPPDPGRRAPRLLIALGALVALVAVGALAKFGYTLATRKVYTIQSGTMEPSIHAGDRINCSRRAPGRLRRGDVVVFAGWRAAPSGVVLVKRVVGLPGETVASDDGTTILVDGTALAEPYAAGGGRPFVAVTVPEDEYFLLGDNRPMSADSRMHGPVPHGSVKGVCRSIVSPGERAGRIPGTP